ncbi:endonuclease MutS2 [Candidatus Magnetominusculus dajiuhuensis]|uniref:endonuclease MutS2 n=1 Tax=Candidatus Magnetominusculus dajiuhuensis TaxID=3137712 RepID=UPI003B42AAB0
MDHVAQRSLEFHKILDMAMSYAVTVAGKALIAETTPSSDIAVIRREIDHISEWRALFSEDKHTAIEPFNDMLPLFTQLHPEGAILEPLELREFIGLFESALSLKRLSIEKNSPNIVGAVSQITGHAFIRRAIAKSIDADGRITDEASPELSSIRKKLAAQEQRVKHILEKLLKRHALEPHIQDDFITIRNGRWVIPVRRDSRGQIPGVIHDISKTGETLFTEPYETQPVGNEIDSLRSEEKIEEFKILKKLSGAIRDNLTDIEKDYELVVILDAVMAKAQFADALKMSAPLIDENRHINIIKGRHPLLLRTLARHNRAEEIVPLDFTLGGDNKSIVITGSNAGGKTVVLKTIGVLHLMALSGMHIPALSGSIIAFVKNIFVDIGDEQSIEDNLSTFSARIGRLAQIVAQSGGETLVLLDELGSGTDPDEGGALGCALLKRLTSLGALSVVTTHLRLLKMFAATTEHITVGAMIMEITPDVNKGRVFRPTYKLSPGELGTSYAFEIAAHYGLNSDIIEDARGFLSGAAIQMETLMSDLRGKISRYERDSLAIKALHDEIATVKDTLRQELDTIQRQKNMTLLKANDEAQKILSSLKIEAKEILVELTKADTLRARELVMNIDKRLAKLGQEKRELQNAHTPQIENLVQGETVRIEGFDADGTVTAIKKGRAVVLVRGREIEVSIGALQRVEGQPPALARRQTSDSELQGMSSFIPYEINLVGQRVDPAISVLERYLNDAAIAEHKDVRIIHGIGTGTLARAVREHLEAHPLVRAYKKGDKDTGGEAVTVVSLNT